MLRVKPKNMPTTTQIITGAKKAAQRPIAPLVVASIALAKRQNHQMSIIGIKNHKKNGTLSALAFRVFISVLVIKYQ